MGDEYDDNIVEFDFTISLEELKSYGKLYEYYMLSLLVTKNIHELIYWEEKNIWCISFLKNWKGRYFTDYYCNTMIHNIGDYYGKKGVLRIDEEQKNRYKDYVDIRDKDEPDSISMYHNKHSRM